MAKSVQDLKYNDVDARHIANLCFGTDEELFVKTKASYVEIRTVKGTLQIQDNGTLWRGSKEQQHEGGYALETDEIRNCWQIVQYLIEHGYALPQPVEIKS